MKKELLKLIRYINLDYFIKLHITNLRSLIYSFRYFKNELEDIVVLESFKGERISDSPLALYNTMSEMKGFEKFTFYWVVSKSFYQTDDMSSKSSVKFVTKGSKDYDSVVSRAKYWISNGVFPLYLKKKSGQVYIQCWHGTPLKKIGLDVEMDSNALHSKKFLDFAFRRDSSRYDFMISPSPYATDKFKSAFALSSKTEVLEYGYPRNDALVRHKCDYRYISSIKHKLNISNRVILFAPTFRDDLYGEGGKSIWYDDLLELANKVGRTTTILFRSHYYDDSHIPRIRNLIDVSNYNDINELYLVSDILVTDYSSVLFDYAILEKPIYIFSKDYEKYRSVVRGMYFDMESTLNVNIHNTISSLHYAIENKHGSSLFEKINCRFNNSVCNDSSFKVLSKVIDNEKN